MFEQDACRFGQLGAAIDGDPAEFAEERLTNFGIEPHLRNLNQGELILELDPDEVRRQQERLDANPRPGLFLGGKDVAVKPDQLRIGRSDRQDVGGRPLHIRGAVIHFYAHVTP